MQFRKCGAVYGMRLPGETDSHSLTVNSAELWVSCAFEVTYLLCNYTPTTKYCASLALWQTDKHIAALICTYKLSILFSVRYTRARKWHPSVSQSVITHAITHPSLHFITLTRLRRTVCQLISLAIKACLWLIDLFHHFKEASSPRAPTTFLFPFTPPSLCTTPAPSAELLPCQMSVSHTHLLWLGILCLDHSTCVSGLHSSLIRVVFT